MNNFLINIILNAQINVEFSAFLLTNNIWVYCIVLWNDSFFLFTYLCFFIILYFLRKWGTNRIYSKQILICYLYKYFIKFKQLLFFNMSCDCLIDEYCFIFIPGDDSRTWSRTWWCVIVSAKSVLKNFETNFSFKQYFKLYFEIRSYAEDYYVSLWYLWYAYNKFDK